MVMRDLIIPPETQDFAMPVDKPRDKLSVDFQTLASIRNKQYSRPRGHVAKVGNIHLWFVKRAKNGIECIAVKFESGATSSHSSDVPRVAESHVGELLLRKKSEKASGEGLL
jgi:hypothetical protein